MSFILLENVDLIFGPNPKMVFEMLDNHQTNEEIQEKTNHVIGVKNVNLSIKKGDIFVLMGLSGSGKSSLLRCINGLHKISRGKIKIGNIDIANCNASILRNLRRYQISMVFQRSSLLPWRTVQENVEFGLELNGDFHQSRQEVGLKNLEIVGLLKWKKHYPHQLSGGMQQRVGLARALSTGAEVLLMDEPFSALDPLIRVELQNELLRLQNELKKTIVFVSHDLREAMRIANQIAIMRNGEVVQVGTPNEIIEKPATDYVRRFVAEA